MKLSRILFLPLLLTPLLALAQVQSATIITRPGVATAPLKYYFDLSSALAEGINQSVKVTISASNAEKTAVRFDSVQLFDQSGATLGRNVASKTDALTATPYAFVFQNFGVPASELKNVAGVQITFMDLGGENSTGKVTVQSVAVSVNRESGDQCIIVDPFIEKIPPPPIPTIISIQTQRPLVRPGTRGVGDQEEGISSGPHNPTLSSNDSAIGTVDWSNYANVYANDNSYASATIGNGSHYLKTYQYGFSIPTGATIKGFVVEIERHAELGIMQDPLSTRDLSIKLVSSSGNVIGSDKASASIWPSSDAYATYGSSLDTWSFVGGPVDINSMLFGVAIAATNNYGDTAFIDHVRMTVYYSPLGASVYDSFIDLLRSLFSKIR